VLRLVDADQLEQRLRVWAEEQHPGDGPLARDGKTLRGSGDNNVPAVHLLALYAVDSGVTVAQAPVGDKTNEHKAALELLPQVSLDGQVVTADALFTHRDFCTAVLEGGGDYVLPAKDNQPTLRRDLEALFAPPAGLSPPPASAGHCRSATGQRGDQGARPAGAAHGDHGDAVERLPGLAGGWSGVPITSGADRVREDNGGGSVRHQQPDAGAGRRG
jgi:hypothetical protein